MLIIIFKQIMKRICLFAGYDKSGIIHDYVVYYIKKMSELAEVYYLGDFDIKDQKELDKLKPYTKYVNAYRHEKYDFGSWQELIINVIGFEKFVEYDEVIFCNDSCYGPLFSLDKMFKKFSKDSEADVLGLTKTVFKNQIFLASFFLVFKKNVIKTDIFKNFIFSIKKENTFIEVVENYEVRLSSILIKNNFRLKFFINENLNMYIDWKTLIKQKFPLLKVKNFTVFSKKYKMQSLFHWNVFLSQNTEYDVSLIEKHLKYLNCKNFNSTFYFLKSYFLNSLRKFVSPCRIHITKNACVIKFFGFCVLNNHFSSKNGEKIKYMCDFYDTENIIKKL